MSESDENQVAGTLNFVCAAAQKYGLGDFILIGGNAVIAHGVPRFTRDVDFVIPEREATRWRVFLEGEGFPFAHQTDAFIQFQDIEKTRPRIDLMVVDESTWSQLNSGASELKLEDGVSTRLAMVEHIIAMKLKAVQSPHRRADAQDWSDILELTWIRKLDPANDSDFADLVLKFGSKELLQKLIDDIALRETTEE